MADMMVSPNLNVNPASNPFNAGVQGAMSGMDWAQGQAAVDLHRQQIQTQKQQNDVMMREANAKLGQQMSDQYMEWAGMDNDSPLKKAKAKNWKDTYLATKTLTPESADEYMASGFDEKTQEGISKMKNALSNVTHPDFLKEMYAASTKMWGQGPKNAEWLSQIADKMIAADAQIKAGQIKIENTNMRAGQRSYDKEIGASRFALEGVSRMKNLLKAAQDPEAKPEDRIRVTKQIRGFLAAEEARLITQKSNFGEGSTERAQVDSYLGQVKDLVNKVADNPALDTMSAGNLKQLDRVYTDLAKSHMQQSDSMANTLMGGSDDTQRKVIQGRHAAFQKEFANRFGKWEGNGVEGVPVPEARKKTAAAPQEKPSDSGQGGNADSLRLAGQAKQNFESKLKANPGMDRAQLREKVIEKLKARGISDDVISKVGF